MEREWVLKTEERSEENDRRGGVEDMKKSRNALTLHITAHGQKPKDKREEHEPKFGEYSNPVLLELMVDIVIGRRGFRSMKIQQYINVRNTRPLERKKKFKVKVRF